jgi:ribosomal protein L27
MFRSKPLNQKVCDNILIRKNEKKLFNGQNVGIEKN